MYTYMYIFEPKFFNNERNLYESTKETYLVGLLLLQGGVEA